MITIIYSFVLLILAIINAFTNTIDRNIVLAFAMGTTFYALLTCLDNLLQHKNWR